VAYGSSLSGVQACKRIYSDARTVGGPVRYLPTFRWTVSFRHCCSSVVGEEAACQVCPRPPGQRSGRTISPRPLCRPVVHRGLNRCLQPRYRSAVWIETCPRRNWICSSSPLARGTSGARPTQVVRSRLLDTGFGGVFAHHMPDGLVHPTWNAPRARAFHLGRPSKRTRQAARSQLVPSRTPPSVRTSVT